MAPASKRRFESGVPAGKPEGPDVPRYHFDLVDSRTVADEGGAELPDDIKAMEAAEEIARRLLAERPDQHELT